MSRENPNRACGHFEAVYGCKACVEAIRKDMPEFPLQSDRPPVKPGPTSVPWSVADRAWAAYSAQYGRSQSVERMAQRAGFSWGEMDMFCPGWREATDEWRKLRAELAQSEESNELADHVVSELRAKLAATEAERDNYLKAFPEYASTGNELREERARAETALAEVAVWKKRWAELKAAPFDGEGECGYCHGVGACPRCWGRAGITKLEEKLKDIEDSFRATVQGKCAPDEKHCSCVPALRLEIERLNALAMKLRTDWDDFDAGVAHGRSMMCGVCHGSGVQDQGDGGPYQELCRLCAGTGKSSVARAEAERDLSKMEIIERAVTPVSKPFDPSKGVVGPEFFLDALEKLMKSGALQKECAHGAEPDYCDGCLYERQKQSVAAKAEAYEVLKRFGRT